MSVSDPIADMFSCIRNAQAVGKSFAAMPGSKIKVAIASLLKKEGYIADFQLLPQKVGQKLKIDLKYYTGRPVISELTRQSKPGLRNYKKCSALPRVRNGYGIAVVSTPKGLMTDREARAAGVGGEILAYVS